MISLTIILWKSVFEKWIVEIRDYQTKFWSIKICPKYSCSSSLFAVILSNLPLSEKTEL
jgi:hypothetical protein